MRHTLTCLIVCVALTGSGLSTLAQTVANPLQIRPHHITASVEDLERAATWYQRVLGFEIRKRGNHGRVNFVELAIPGFGIALVHDPAMPVHANAGGTGAPRWVHIVFSVPDPDAVYRLVKSRGASVSTREDAAGKPIHSFLVKDSEGNEIEFVGDPLP